MTLFDINLTMLKIVKDKGFCLCDIKKNEDNSNICPCNTFLETKNCKCKIYNIEK